jgi:protein archease
MRRGYRFIDHTADFRLEIFGTDARDLFLQAALALTDLIADPRLVRPRKEQVVEVAARDWADLMVNWLRELLYLWNGEEQLVCRVVLEILEQTRLRAKVVTGACDPAVNAIRNEIKAVTYHQIEAGPHKTGWRARVIFDI